MEETVEIIKSFREKKILLNFMKNFAPVLDFSHSEFLINIIKQYKLLKIEDTNQIDNLLSYMNTPLDSKVELYIKDNFPDYFLLKINKKDISKDIYFIKNHINEDNLYKYISEKIINNENVNLLLSSKEIDYYTFTELFKSSKDILLIDIDKIWGNFLNENENNRNKKTINIINSKIDYLFNIKAYPGNSMVNKLLNQFLLSSSLNNASHIKTFVKKDDLSAKFIFDFIHDNKIKVKKINEKLIMLFSIMNKAKTLEAINQEYKLKRLDMDIFSILLKIMTINPSKKMISYEEIVSLKIIMELLQSNSNPMDLIKENNKVFYKIKEMMLTQKSFVDIIFNSFSFDTLSRNDPCFFEEGHIISEVVDKNKDWELFFNYFAENCKIKKPIYFKDILVRDIGFENWNNIMKIIEKNSPKFYKEIMSKDLYNFEKNPKIYALMEKESLLKSCQNEVVIKNKKRL